MPLPLIVPIVLLGGGALALALGKKKTTAPTVTPTPAGTTPEQLTWEQTVNKQYQDAMASTDLDFVGRAVTWMNTYGNRPNLTQAMQAHYQDVYRAKAQQAAYTQATGGPPSSQQLTDVYNTAMASSMNDPAQLQWASALLRANGRSAQANEIDTKANSILLATGKATATPQGIVSTVPTAPPAIITMPEEKITAQEPGGIRGTQPSAGPSIQQMAQQAAEAAQGLLTTFTTPTAATPPTPTPAPIQTAEVKPQADPNGTIGLARLLIEVESQSGWKTALQSNVQVWQSKMGLTTDGKFGPKSALKMADEVGVLPLIRYWSATGGTKDKQVGAYRASLLSKAKVLRAIPLTQAHAIALEQSATRETGQGYSANPPALDASSITDAASRLNNALATITSA
jgi:hypothetical protein